MPIREFNSKHRVWQSFSHSALDFDGTIFFRQALPTPMYSVMHSRGVSLGQGGGFIEIGLRAALQNSGRYPEGGKACRPRIQGGEDRYLA